MTLNIFTVCLLRVWILQVDSFKSFAMCFKRKFFYSLHRVLLLIHSTSSLPVYVLWNLQLKEQSSYFCTLFVNWVEKMFFMLLKNKQQKTYPKQKKKKTHQTAIEMLISSWRPSDIGQILGGGLNKSSTLNGRNKTICLSRKGKKGEKGEKKKGGEGRKGGAQPFQ